MKRLFSAFLFAFVLSISLQAHAQCGVHCGTERWRVKTLTDSTVDNIEPDEVSRTIQWFRIRTRPASLPNYTRLIGVETMTFRVRGQVLHYKLEPDKDFHVVMLSRIITTAQWSLSLPIHNMKGCVAQLS